MKTYLTGFETKEATFSTVSTVKPARAVAYTETGDVYYPENGGHFTGIVSSYRDGFATVIMSGYAVGSFKNTQPTMGICKLSPDSQGYLEVDEANGKPYTVLSVDTINKTFEFIL